MTKYVVPLVCAIVLILAGCSESPVDKLTNPISEGALSGTAGVYNIYDDQLQTGGNFALFPGDYHEHDMVEEISGGCSESPDLCIKYTWDGGNVCDDNNNWSDKWCGLAAIVPSIAANWGANNTRDLSVGKYTKITFYAKGTLSSGVDVRFESPSNTASVTPGKSGASALSTKWQKYTIDITGVSLSAIQHYFIVVFDTGGSGGSTGGTVYVDQIKYE